MKKIPEIVLGEAKKHGFNEVSYIGEYKGAQVYSVGFVDKDGLAVPTGLPTSILVKDLSSMRSTPNLSWRILLI